MNFKHPIPFILLLLGYFFSSVAGFHFNLSNGFNFQDFYVNPQFQLLDFALYCSPEVCLNSQLFGYFFYLVFAIDCAKKMEYYSGKGDRIMLFSFFLLLGLVFISDFYSFYQDLSNQFTGRHFRIGFLVFLIGLSINFRLQWSDKQLEEKC
jgi:hypothetical protein